MNRVMVLLIGVVAAIVLGGCVDQAPAYRESLLAFDETLVGTWQYVKPPNPDAEGDATGEQKTDTLDVEISAQRRLVTYGRLGKYNRNSGVAKNEHAATTYLITLRGIEDDGTEFLRKYDAVLLNLEGTRVLAYQISEEEKTAQEYFGDMLPVHKVVRIERDGDVLKAWMMKRAIVWVPGVRPLAAEEGEVRLPTEDGTYFVADSDRFVEAVRLAVREGEWAEEAVEVKRVK